jgi:hypothetical protein
MNAHNRVRPQLYGFGAAGSRPRVPSESPRRGYLEWYDKYVAFDGICPERRWHGEGGPGVADLWFVLLTVGLFAVLALLVKAVERL